jgi:tryptophan synthase alpha chain
VLESYIREQCLKKDILLMTHIVIGYPSLAESFHLVETMVEAGVDIMELQIPFSEPMADGPVIVRANQEALAGGIRVADCLEFGSRVAETFPIPFLFMSYYNILFRQEVETFVSRMAESGLRGAIVPDLPPEEGEGYLKAMTDHDLSPILLFSPTTSSERMVKLSAMGRGFIYCVARKGVTGAKTQFAKGLSEYLSRCRQSTRLPLALGFGVSGRQDLDFLQGKVEIAVIGTQVIRVLDREGIPGVRKFLDELTA